MPNAGLIIDFGVFEYNPSLSEFSSLCMHSQRHCFVTAESHLRIRVSFAARQPVQLTSTGSTMLQSVCLLALFALFALATRGPVQTGEGISKYARLLIDPRELSFSDPANIH